ncbi:MAG: succinate dehydrogenase/fumarate reductase iron-sulfur subunit, partial [Acidimicrobiales bacterium]
CPEDIHITDNAIIPLKERVVDARYDPIAWLGRKILSRPGPLPAAEAAKHTGAAAAAVRGVAEARGAPAPASDGVAGATSD